MSVNDGTFMEVEDDWPRWEWTNDTQRHPIKVMVEPPFKAELGDVFLRMDLAGQSVGCWFTRERWDEMHQAGLRAAAHPSFETLEAGRPSPETAAIRPVAAGDRPCTPRRLPLEAKSR